MKHLRFFTMVMGCLAAVGVAFTSCDDDDDTHSLTPQERQTAFNAVKGSYSGKLVYLKVKNEKNQTDTTSITWSIDNDSTLTINQFPVSLLAGCMSDSTAARVLRQCEPQDMKCAIGFIRVDPATFIINPATPTFNVTYDGATHKIQVPFYINSYNSFGELGYTNLRMQIVAGAVYVDGKDSGWLVGGIPFMLTAKTSDRK